MSLPEEEIKRALRAATRSLEEAKASVLLEDAHQNVALAVQQLVLVLERMIGDERANPSPDHRASSFAA